MKYVIALCVLCSFSTMAAPELKGTPEELRQFLHPSDHIVTIQGENTEKAYSDQAIVSLVVTTEKKKLAEALQANADLRADIAKSLIAAGVPADHIKSSKFSTSPQYGWFGKTPDSFEVVNRMSIRVTNAQHMQQVAKLADQNEAISWADTQFEHSQKEQTKQKVRAKALDDVMRQKAFYEKTLGVKLVAVNFREGYIGYAAAPGAGLMQRDRSPRVEKMASVSSIQAETPMPQSFDEIEYQAHVFVDFVIERSK